MNAALLPLLTWFCFLLCCLAPVLRSQGVRIKVKHNNYFKKKPQQYQGPEDMLSLNFTYLHLNTGYNCFVLVLLEIVSVRVLVLSLKLMEVMKIMSLQDSSEKYQT